MPEFNIEDYIIRQLNGTLSEDEAIQLHKWYISSSENKKMYRDYCILLKSHSIASIRPLFDMGKDASWNRIKGMLGKQLNKRRHSIFYYSARYAAVAAIAFCLGMGVFRLFTSEMVELAQTIEIPLGSKSRITLPDGSEVWLNSGTRLSYRNGFGKTNRILTMDGEGCFDVTKNKDLPFEIVSGQTKIRVLGTKFNLKAYSADERTRVTLIEGSLNVIVDGKEENAVKIAPNQQAVFDKQTQSMKVNRVNALNYANWTVPKSESVSLATQAVSNNPLTVMTVPNTTLRNTLFFDEEPLEQIVRDLSRAFNVTIELKDKGLASEIYYGDFRNGEDLIEILNIITGRNDLKYEVKDNKIIITKIEN